MSEREWIGVCGAEMGVWKNKQNMMLKARDVVLSV